jgi:hypothetical protein
MRYLFLLVCLISAVTGKIIEFHSFQDLSAHLTPDTLVLLDIDDTLLITRQMLGCDEWFNHRIKMHKQNGMDHSRALEKALAEWEAIRHLTHMDIVEPNSQSVIHSLQKQGYRVMGLTTQGLALATRTIQQLEEIGIDLSLTAPTQEHIYLPTKTHGVLFKKGVLFTSGTHKGEALFQFCQTIDHPVCRIVFVNDKENNIREIEGTANDCSVEFLGLRYAYSDARKKAFSPEVADVQFHHSNFAQILSDEEAKEIVCKAALHAIDHSVDGIGKN